VTSHSPARISARVGRRRLVCCVALACLFTTSTAARAGDIDRAKKLFEEGIHLYQQGDWEGARRVFREADAEHHAPAIVYNLALAEEKLGHLQLAVDAYEAYVAEVGDKGPLSSSAVVAIAQIRARSTRLKIETKPAGAHVFVDGTVLADAAPTAVLVQAGRHVVVVQGEGWRAEREVEARGAGDMTPLLFEPAAPAHADVPSPGSNVTTPHEVEPRRVSAPAADGSPDGFVWGAAFAMMPCFLLGVNVSDGVAAPPNSRPASSILAGPSLNAGYALTDRFVFLGRGFVGIGPDAKPSWGFIVGPGLSYRVGSFLWLGASFIGGQIETKAHGARYGTDQVFGASAEASVVVIRKPHGEWTVSVEPGFLLTEMRQDNTAFVFPLTFGYRAY
jgi:hypothetical protein